MLKTMASVTNELPSEELPTVDLDEELNTENLFPDDDDDDLTDIALNIKIPKLVLNVNFNQNMSCFTCCTEGDVRIYNTDPLAEHCRLPFNDIGSISQAQMIYRSNILGVVSGGNRPNVPDNILRIFCFEINDFISEITFHSSIKAFRMRKDDFVVATLNHIHFFSFPEPTELLFSLETPTNTRGILEVSPSAASENQVIIFPGENDGSLRLVNISDALNTVKELSPKEYLLTESLQTEEKTLAFPIQAHEGELCCIALSHQATKIATASVHGTLIRIWDVETRTKVVELRRGSDVATIYSMSFSLNTEYLCCSSDKGTLHIFAIENLNLNKRLNVPSASNVLGKYGESLWAFTSITLPPECACVVGFCGIDNVIAIGMDGSFHKYGFLEDGTCSRKVYTIFLNAKTSKVVEKVEK